MPNITIDQKDSKMLDSVMNTIHARKVANGLNMVAVDTSGSFEPISKNKHSNMFIIDEDENDVK